MDLSFDAPLPQRFRQRPEGIPTPANAARKYEREKFRAQLKQIDDVTAGIETDVVALESQLMGYVKQSAVFQQFLPRIEYIIEAMRQSEAKHIQETAAAFQNALQVLQVERDELFEDLPPSYKKLERLNEMQREFITRLSAIQKTLPVTPDINALKKYLWETKESPALPLPQQQPNTREKDEKQDMIPSTPAATKVAEEGLQTFWDYWTLLLATFHNKVKQDPSFRIDSLLTPDEKRKVLTTIERIYVISIPSYALSDDIVQTWLLKEDMIPDPKKLTPICAGYPPVLTVLSERKCVDLFDAVVDIVNGKVKDTSGIVPRAKEIITGYYILTEKLEIKRVYMNRALQTPLWYRVATDANAYRTIPLKK